MIIRIVLTIQPPGLSLLCSFYSSHSDIGISLDDNGMVVDTRGTPREHSDQVNKVANTESSPNTSEMERNSTDADEDPSSASNSGKESTGNNAAKSTTPAKSLFPSTDDSASLVESFDKKKKFQQDLETGMVKFNQSAKKGMAPIPNIDYTRRNHHKGGKFNLISVFKIRDVRACQYIPTIKDLVFKRVSMTI